MSPHTIIRPADLARAAVVELFRGEIEWRKLFGKSCREGADRLRAIVPQVGDELAERGKRFKLEEVEDALLALAREKLPASPPPGGMPHGPPGFAEKPSSASRGALRRADRSRARTA